MCKRDGVSYMLVVSLIENVAAHIQVIDHDLSEAREMLDIVSGYLSLVRTCPALSAGNGRIARRELAELLGERTDDQDNPPHKGPGGHHR